MSPARPRRPGRAPRTAVASYFALRAREGERRALHFADEANRRRVEAVAARDFAARQSATLTFDKGRDLAEKGEAARGVHWMLEGLRLAEPLDWPEFRAMALVSLAGWGRQLGGLQAVASHDDRVPAVAFAPEGRAFATGSRDGTARRWDASSGTPTARPGSGTWPPPGRSARRSSSRLLSSPRGSAPTAGRC